MEMQRIIRQQHQRLYYPRYFRFLLKILWLTLVINIILVPVLIFLYFSQSKPLYYANSFDGKITPVTPIEDFRPSTQPT